MKISIVTVHLDNFSGLQKTYHSIQALGLLNVVEWIVIDGGSSPDSAADEAILLEIESGASHYRSEPDRGIYDAMNKGTQLATGDYLLYLNSGDQLHPDFDLQTLHGILNMESPDMLWGQCFDQDLKNEVYPRKTRKPGWLRFGMPVSHQAILFARESLGLAPYDLDFEIGADYDLLCRKFRQGARIVRSRIPICIYDLVGHSSMDRLKTLLEESRIRRKNFNTALFLDRVFLYIKLILWNFHSRFPVFRRLWRRRV